MFCPQATAFLSVLQETLIIWLQYPEQNLWLRLSAELVQSRSFSLCVDGKPQMLLL